MTSKDGDRIQLASISVTFENNGDCVDTEPQSITLRTENNGIANFVVMETSRWSASDIDSLVAMIRRFEAIADKFIGYSIQEETLEPKTKKKKG